MSHLKLSITKSTSSDFRLSYHRTYKFNFSIGICLLLSITEIWIAYSKNIEQFCAFLQVLNTRVMSLNTILETIKDFLRIASVSNSLCCSQYNHKWEIDLRLGYNSAIFFYISNSSKSIIFVSFCW